MLKPFFRESGYCATCHKVGLSEPVNNYRWLRGQNEFDSWDDSGVSLNAARTFYLPPARQVCQDCHMPLEPAPRGDMAAANGMVRSHRFLGANTALPYLRGDTATLRRIEDFLRAEKLRVDVFAVRVGAAGAVPRPAEQGAGAAMPEADGVAGATWVLADRGSGVPAGVPVTFDVVVRNLGVGHTFPGGTNDSNEGWIEFTVTDEDGRRLAASGLLADDGHLDPFAHTFKAVMVDRDGNAIRKRNAQDIHATVYKNVIGPGSADVAHYELTLPPELAGSEVTVSARLLWRKFDRVYTEFAFETNPSGFGGFDAVPDLPVTEIAADSVRVLVIPGGGALAGETAGVADRARMGDRPVERPRAEPVGNVDWTRHNDYGIALLLEGDHRRAAEAFSRVEMLEPGRIDGPLNLARTALAGGATWCSASRRSPGWRRSRPEMRAPPGCGGQALQEDGRYEEARAGAAAGARGVPGRPRGVALAREDALPGRAVRGRARRAGQGVWRSILKTGSPTTTGCCRCGRWGGTTRPRRPRPPTSTTGSTRPRRRSRGPTGLATREPTSWRSRSRCTGLRSSVEAAEGPPGRAGLPGTGGYTGEPTRCPLQARGRLLACVCRCSRAPSCCRLPPVSAVNSK